MQPKVFKEESSKLEYLKNENGSDTAIIMFHGFGASMLDLYGLGDAIQPDKAIDWIFPNGFIPLNMGIGMMSRAWFPIDMIELERAMQAGTHRDFSGLYTDEFELAINTCQTFFDQLKKSYKKIIIGGFSQGAMVSTHLALKNSDSIEGLICFSGALIGKQQIMDLTENSQNFSFIQSHGKSDPVLGYEGAKSLFELLKLSGHEGEFISFDGAHEIPQKVVDKTSKFISRILR